MKLVCTKLDLKGIRTYFTRRQILMKLYSWKWIPNDGAPPFHIAPMCQQFSEECNGSQNKICKCWKFRKLHHYFVHSSFLQCIRGFSISVKKCLCNFGKLALIWVVKTTVCPFLHICDQLMEAGDRNWAIWMSLSSFSISSNSFEGFGE